MALKRKIDKAAFDALSADVKKEYKKNGSSDDYILDTEGDDDRTTELRQALDNTREELKTLKKTQKAADDKATEERERAEREAKKKANDFDGIEADYKNKLTAKDAEITGIKVKHAEQLRNALVGAAAKALAAKISTSPSLIEPIIAARLTVDTDSDNPITRVLGADGKASALTVDDLGKELASNPEYKAIMIASKSSGGGGAPPNGNRSGTSGIRLPTSQSDPNAKPPVLANMGAKELAATLQARREAAKEGTS